VSAVVAIHVIKGSGQPVATQYVDHEQNDGWEDPHGGEFSDAEQKQFDAVATGDTRLVTLYAGTPNEITFPAAIIVTLM
jgi:hypothetical protein